MEAKLTRKDSPVEDAMEVEFLILSSLLKWERSLVKKSRTTLLRHSKDWWLTISAKKQLNRLRLSMKVLSATLATWTLSRESGINVVFAKTLISVISVKLIKDISIHFLKLEILLMLQLAYSALTAELRTKKPNRKSKNLSNSSRTQGKMLRRKSYIMLGLWRKTLEKSTRLNQEKLFLKFGPSEMRVKLLGPMMLFLSKLMEITLKPALT